MGGGWIGGGKDKKSYRNVSGGRNPHNEIYVVSGWVVTGLGGRTNEMRLQRFWARNPRNMIDFVSGWVVGGLGGRGVPMKSNRGGFGLTNLVIIFLPHNAPIIKTSGDSPPPSYPTAAGHGHKFSVHSLRALIGKLLEMAVL